MVGIRAVQHTIIISAAFALSFAIPGEGKPLEVQIHDQTLQPLPLEQDISNFRTVRSSDSEQETDLTGEQPPAIFDINSWIIFLICIYFILGWVFYAICYLFFRQWLDRVIHSNKAEKVKKGGSCVSTGSKSTRSTSGGTATTTNTRTAKLPPVVGDHEATSISQNLGGVAANNTCRNGIPGANNHSQVYFNTDTTTPTTNGNEIQENDVDSTDEKTALTIASGATLTVDFNNVNQPQNLVAQSPLTEGLKSSTVQVYDLEELQPLQNFDVHLQNPVEVGGGVS